MILESELEAVGSGDPLLHTDFVLVRLRVVSVVKSHFAVILIYSNLGRINKNKFCKRLLIKHIRLHIWCYAESRGQGIMRSSNAS